MIVWVWSGNSELLTQEFQQISSLVFVAQKIQTCIHLYCPVKVNFPHMGVKNSELAFFTRMFRKGSLRLDFFKVKVKLGYQEFRAVRKLSQSDSSLKVAKVLSE